MRSPGLYTALAILLLLCGLASSSPGQGPRQDPAEKEITAAGSGVNLEITRILAHHFMNKHPGTKIEIPGSIGSNGAIKAVSDGAIALGLMSRPLSDPEKTLGLTVLPYARTALVVAVHPGVEDEGITFEELVDIFRGKKTNWKDGSEIIVLSREKFDSGFNALSEKVPGFKSAHAESLEKRRWLLSFTDQENSRALTSRPHSIGVTDLGMISTERLNVKVLKLNGIYPTPEDVRSGRYPLVRELAFIYRKDKLPGQAKAFLDFVMSGEGADILKSQGYLCVEQGK